VSYSDTRFRQMLTLPQTALLNEYERCTKRTVTLDYIRLSALATLEIRDITVDDVFLVIRYVRKRIRAGDNKRKIGTFTPASLEFGNLFGDYAKFEDRLQTARAEMAEKRVVKGKMVAVQRGEITRLEETREERAPEQMRTAVADVLRTLITQIEAP